MPPGDIDAIAKSFPHIRARDARHALRDRPELRAANLSELSQVLERIRLVRGISSTETSIHLQTYRLS